MPAISSGTAGIHHFYLPNLSVLLFSLPWCWFHKPNPAIGYSDPGRLSFEDNGRSPILFYWQNPLFVHKP